MRPRRVAAVTAAVIALATVAAPAAAQSKRYPRPPVDAEAEAEAKSDFWDEVVRPGARRYEQIVTATTDSLRIRGSDASRALEPLREAIALRPDLVEAWGYLGVAAERTRSWATCADAYRRAFAIDPRWRPSRLAPKSETSLPARTLAMRPLEQGLGMCLSRSGDLAGAAAALESLVARGEASGETWLRLGEVYMAEGRLAEAITAFDQARNDPAVRALSRWLLAVAYDRARRPGDADAAAAEAGDVGNPTSGSIPFVPAADVYYVRAFAARNAPEKALALFRLYLDQAPPDSPWRARAEEHVAGLSELDLAAHVEIQGSGDRPAIERAVRAAMPALRACVAPVPMVMIELRITQVGPPGKPKRVPGKTPIPPEAPRPPFTRFGGRPPPASTQPRRPPDAETPGVRAVPVIFEPGKLDGPRDLAVDCVEKVGLGLTLPRPAADTYSTVRIPVVADR